MPNSVAVDTALRVATKKNDISALRRALNAGDDIDLECVRANEPDNLNLCPSLLLHAVVYGSSSALIQFIIDAGANVNCFMYIHDDTIPVSALTVAVQFQTPDAVAALIAGGADVNRNNQADQAVGEHSKWSPVYTAICKGHRGILLNLLRAGGIFTRDLLEQIHNDHANFAADILPDSPALLLVERFIRTADWAGFVRHHRGVLVSILAKCFGDALPREVLAEIATHWAPPGGS